MPSGIRKTTGNHFEIYYEQPWGGVASYADPVDIADNELVAQQGLIEVEGELCYVSFPPGPPAGGGGNGDGPIMGFPLPPIPDTTTYIALLFSINGSIYAISNLGDVLIYNADTISWSNPGTAPHFGPPDYPWASPPTAVKVINGSAYVTNYGTKSIYQLAFGNGIKPVATWGQTVYTGGLYLGILDDYLLQLFTNNTVDGQQQARVNWSAPGAFLNWDAATDQTAGFNTLAIEDDAISGFLSLASVGVIITRKSLIEVSPTGVGIAPFAFTQLWISDVGEGCVYPDTISQYGQIGYLATDSGFYQVSTSGGFQSFIARAKKAIYNSFQSYNNTLGANAATQLITGCVMLYTLNSAYSTPFYLFAAAKYTGSVGSSSPILVVWFFNIATQSWQSTLLDIDALASTQFGTALSNGVVQFVTAQTFNVLPPTSGVPGGQTSTDFVNPITLINICLLYGPNYYNLILTPYIYNRSNHDSSVHLAGTINLVFKAEEIKLGHTRKATVRRGVIKAYGTGTLNVTITDVNGNVTSLGAIVLDGTTNARTYYTPQGIATVECPQLRIVSSNFKGVIVKAMLACTYADGDID